MYASISQTKSRSVTEHADSKHCLPQLYVQLTFHSFPSIYTTLHSTSKQASELETF